MDLEEEQAAPPHVVAEESLNLRDSVRGFELQAIRLSRKGATVLIRMIGPATLERRLLAWQAALGVLEHAKVTAPVDTNRQQLSFNAPCRWDPAADGSLVPGAWLAGFQWRDDPGEE